MHPVACLTVRLSQLQNESRRQQSQRKEIENNRLRYRLLQHAADTWW